ncbi:MAG: LSU ribosomal protein L13p (L13Ae), partial [uncultured Solirubrobacterales bacterium]
EDLRSHPRQPRASLDRRRRDGPHPRPPLDEDRRCAARQAQAGVHAALRHRRLRGRGQRGEDRGHRQEAPAEALLPPLRLPRRPARADLRRDAGPPARGDHPPRGQGDAAPQPPRAPAAAQAQDLRRARASPRRPAAETDGDRDAM